MVALATILWVIAVVAGGATMALPEGWLNSIALVACVGSFVAGLATLLLAGAS